MSASTAGGVAGAAADIVTFDPTLLTGSTITSYNVATSSYGVKLANLAAAPTVNVIGNISGAAGLIMTLKTASGAADSATLVFNNNNTTTTGNNAGVAVAKLTVGDGTDWIETLNIQSKGLITGTGAANTLTTLDTGAKKAPGSIVITGDQAFKLTTGAVASDITIDGSAATAALTISSATTKKININGGTANDTITLTAAAVSGGLIYGGKGGDAITLGGAHNGETLVYKAATDSLVDVTNPATKTTMDTVTNFLTTKDKIDLSTFAFSAAQKGAVVYDAAVYANGAAVLTAATSGTATWFNDATATARAVKMCTDGTDSYLFVDANKDGQFSATADAVIKLAGLAAANSTTLALADLAF